ncbi:MAG: hypothetical protein QOD13_3284 [Thermoleophilaceae bacterium]|jgi:hypothetical protein|nr:hypothetical protein [Thermoleophilaceae bacterium]
MSVHDSTMDEGNSGAALAYPLWALVAVGLAYGIYKTLDTALALFGG